MSSPTSGPNDKPPPMPRWVKVSGVIAILFVITVIVVHLAGGGMGNHGAR
jgi:hypothetical protein